MWCRIEKNCIISVFKKHRVTHHLYADDKQGYVDVPISNIATARTTLQYCVFDVSSWCSSRRLQVNTGKTEFIWFGTRQSLQKANDDNLALQLALSGTTRSCCRSARTTDTTLWLHQSSDGAVCQTFNSLWPGVHGCWSPCLEHSAGGDNHVADALYLPSTT